MMRRIACVGSGPASLVLALAIKRADAAIDVTIVRRDPEKRRADPGFAVSFHLRRGVIDELKALSGAAFSLHRWRQTDIFRCGEHTTVSGGLAGSICRDPLMSSLDQASIESGCRMVSDLDRSETEFADFDIVAVEADTISSHGRFTYDIVESSSLGVSFTAPRLAADRVLEVVELGGTYFFGHGYRVSDHEAIYVVEARKDAWSSAGLVEAGDDGLSAFAAQAFRRSLDGAALAGVTWRDDTGSAIPRHWQDDRFVLFGGTATCGASLLSVSRGTESRRCAGSRPRHQRVRNHG